jgi:L-lysine exporter family protein LysE/ArgO
MDTAAFLQGLLLALALIASLGPQNLHVLETGLRGRHVGPTVALCIAADALLIGVAVAGVARGLAPAEPYASALRWATAAWCAAWSLRSLRASLGRVPQAVNATPGGRGRLRTLLVTGAVTFGNPALYAETLLVVGGAAASLEATARTSFGSGALAASALWFCTLGYGARCAARWLARPAPMGALHLFSALVMGVVAARMVVVPPGA